MHKKLINLLLVAILLASAFAFLIWYSTSMPGQALISELKPLSHEQFHLSQRLSKHVSVLAGEIGERHYQLPKAYQQAATYIEQAFTENGLVPYAEIFGKKSEYRNIIAEHYGTQLPDEIIIIGAHYDTVWMTPGADDNASGVAVLLELAQAIKDMTLKRTVRFIAFANEEHPHFLREDMGSLYHAKRASERGESINAMLSLEMLGFYSNDPGSQFYPKPFNSIYPDTANYIAFVSNLVSRPLLRFSLQAFRDSGEFPSEGLAAPVALVPDVRRSDQSAFWSYGYPAIMVTDTAAYRNNAYHNVNDVPISLDYKSMARVTTGLIYVVRQLADRVNE